MAHKFPALLNHEILKPSATIHIEHRISMIEQQVWNKLFQNAFRDMKENGIFKISVKELVSFFPYEYKNINHLKKSLKQLVETSVEFNVFEKDKKEWGIFSLLSEAKIKDGICTYAYTSTLKDLMMSKDMYTKVNLLIQQEFVSKYSLFIYELCLDYHKIKQTPMMELEEFRHFLGMKDGLYSEFKEFNKFVLKPAVKEINKKTELFVEIERGKTGRKISGIKFLISKNKKQPASSIQDSLLPIEEDIYALGEKQKIFDTIKKSCPGISEAQIKKIIAESSVEKIEIALKYTKERAEKNPSAYLNEILKNENFGNEEIEARKKREIRKEKALERLKKEKKEEDQEKIKSKNISDFIEKNPEIYKKILAEKKKEAEENFSSLSEKLRNATAKGTARGEISKMLEK
jgi:plasmid replication initiation protein